MSDLKPRIDAIFADVLNHLPTIDFDLSDVSSDSDEPVFRRNLKVFDLDYDEDTAYDDSQDTDANGEKQQDYQKEFDKPSEKQDRERAEKYLFYNSKLVSDEGSTDKQWDISPNPSEVVDDRRCRSNVSGLLLEQKGNLLSETFDSELTELANENPACSGILLNYSLPTELPANQDDPTEEKALTDKRMRELHERSFSSDGVISELANCSDLVHLRCQGEENEKIITSWSDIRINEINNNSLSLTSQEADKNERNLKKKLEHDCGEMRIIHRYIDESVNEERNEEVNDDGLFVESGFHDNSTGEKWRESVEKSHDTRRLKTTLSQRRQSVSDSMMGSTEMPVTTLSFDKLKDFDLDTILKKLIEGSGDLEETSASTLAPSSVAQTDTESPSHDDRVTILQRLTEFASLQSGEDLGEINPETGALCGRSRGPTSQGAHVQKESGLVNSLHHFKEQGKDDLDVKVTLSATVLNPQSSSFTKTGCPKTVHSDDTVYLDLRNFEEKRREQEESIARVQRVLGITPDTSKHESDSEDDEELYKEQRRLIKSGVIPPSCVERKKPPGPPPRRQCVTPPTRVTDLSKTNYMKNKLSSTNATINHDHIPATTNQKSATSIGTSPVDPPVNIDHKKQQRKVEPERKLRERKSCDHEKRVRLADQINKLRSTASVSERLPAAEATPIIYDPEVSYEPPLSSLPSPLSGDIQLLLLSVSLSGCGEILQHKSSKVLNAGPGLSATYTSLLVWLLTLIPQNFDFLHSQRATNSEPPFNQPPFRVLGLQQLMLDGERRLLVAIAPPNQSASRSLSNKTRKSKPRSLMKDCSPFMRDVSRFLGTHNLRAVCPFLDDIIPVDIASKTDESSKYVYRPPVPDISAKMLSTFVQMSPDIGAARKLFAKDVSFVWQTADTGEYIYEHGLEDTSVTNDVQNTMSLVYRNLYGDSYAMIGVFNRILQLGLNISGIRLLYPTPDILHLSPIESPLSHQSHHDLLTNVGPIIAIALRGAFARTRWLDTCGPSDPAIARKTNPNSLSALCGGETREENMLFVPSNASRTAAEMIRWFGGRVALSSDVLDIGIPYHLKQTWLRKNTKNDSDEQRKNTKITADDSRKFTKYQEDDEIPPQRPPAALTATVKGQIIMVLRTLMPPRCVGLVLRGCEWRAYLVRGLRRLLITKQRATTLGLSPRKDVDTLDCPHIVLLLEAENAWHNAASLVQDLMVQMCLAGIAGDIQAGFSQPLTGPDLFHTMPLTTAIIASICPEFTKCPDQGASLMSPQCPTSLHTNPEMEQIVVLILSGNEILKQFGMVLAELLSGANSTTKCRDRVFDGFELLGIKWLPTLTIAQANEVTPYEIGDRKWRPSIHSLISEPALVTVLRGINAFKRLSATLKSSITNTSHTKTATSPEIANIDKIMSLTAEQAFRFVSLFFHDRELMADNSVRFTLDYLPPTTHPRKSSTESITSTMLASPTFITSLLLVKPSAVKRHLASILKKLHQEKFKVVALRMVQLSDAEAVSFVSVDIPENTEMHAESCRHLTSAASIIIVVMAENCVKKLIDLIGPCDPVVARRESQFLWRGIFGSSLADSGIQASTSYQNAIANQTYFFSGLCTDDHMIYRLTQLPCPPIDDIIGSGHHVIHKKTQAGVSTFLQTTCVLLTPALIDSDLTPCHPPYVDVIASLTSHGFKLVGARMVWLTAQQASACLHHAQNTTVSADDLIMGPTLVLAAQRDNAILTFDSLLSRNTHGDSVISRYGSLLIRPLSVSAADDMLAYFFNILCDAEGIEISNHRSKDQ